GDGLFGMKGALVSSETLADHLGVLVDENGHACSPYRCGSVLGLSDVFAAGLPYMITYWPLPTALPVTISSEPSFAAARSSGEPSFRETCFPPRVCQI